MYIRLSSQRRAAVAAAATAVVAAAAAAVKGRIRGKLRRKQRLRFALGLLVHVSNRYRHWNSYPSSLPPDSRQQRSPALQPSATGTGQPGSRSPLKVMLRGILVLVLRKGE